MIVKDIEQLSLRLSPIIHILITQDFGPFSDFMNHYVEFLRNHSSDQNKSKEHQDAMYTLYLGMYSYLSGEEDRSIALLQHLQETSIEFLNGELPVGKIEIEYEEETV